MSSKISKNPKYDDPTAFKKRFPRIEPSNNATLLSGRFQEKAYKMGNIRVVIAEPQEGNPGYSMSIHTSKVYADWDSIVWIRYNLIPDAARMSMVLPNLNAYINQEDGHYKFVFTFEQSGWVVDPYPVCSQCEQKLVFKEVHLTTGFFHCASCDLDLEVDLKTWNEQHGNGLNGRRK